jgi:hypothetical protein
MLGARAQLCRTSPSEVGARAPLRVDQRAAADVDRRGGHRPRLVGRREGGCVANVLHFAGEHTSLWIAWMNGALESAERVTQEILDADAEAR